MNNLYKVELDLEDDAIVKTGLLSEEERNNWLEFGNSYTQIVDFCQIEYDEESILSGDENSYKIYALGISVVVCDIEDHWYESLLSRIMADIHEKEHQRKIGNEY